MPRSDENRSRASGRLYRPLDFVMLRAPLLPVESYLALEGATIESLTRIADPRVRCALAIGSPSLLDALDRTTSNHEKTARLMSKLRRFLVRMSTRPTPYGMFAGAAIAGWGKRTEVSMSGTRTRTRVDMHWLVQYVITLDAQAPIRNQLRWVANSAAWLHHNRVALSARVPPQSTGPTASVSIAAKPVVRRALDMARAPVPYQTLVDRLVASTPSATREKVEAVLQQLWGYGFLLTELMPPLTIESPIQWVRDRLATIVGGKALCVQLDGLLRAVEACDIAQAEQAPAVLRKAATHASILGRTETGKGSALPLQVDMALSLNGTLSSKIGDEAARAADVLLRLTPVPNGPPNVAGYRQAFVARYGHDREVPLLELVHPEWGLGPIGRHSSPGRSKDQASAVRRAAALQQLALNAIREAQTVVELDEGLFKKIEIRAPAADRIPVTLDLNLFVLASSPAAIDAGDFQLMLGPNVGAPAAGRNLGRFAHLLGRDACFALERWARHDEERHPRQITAEIAYLPRNFRTANVAVRPSVRRYEIVQGVSAGVDRDNVVPLDELVVGIRQGRFYVRWTARNVEVLVTSGHMLNPNQAPPECHLLSEIGRDGIAQLSAFDWGPAGEYLFLPRVQSGRLILCCAQWRLDPIVGDEELIGNAGKYRDWFARWRERWQVPRRVYLSWADNRLLYDLDDPEQVEDLRLELVHAKGKGQWLLQEALPGPEHAWLPSPDGGHRIVELVVSVAAAGEPGQTAAVIEDLHPSYPVSPALRLRPPGSDWLYLKLYGPRSSEDELLAGPVRSLCREISEERTCVDWFFLRYADPEPHLRLRFRGTPERLAGTLFPKLCAWASRLVSDGQCQEFSFDTYEREIERYGGPEGIAVAEALFAADSNAVVELLACAPRIERTLLALVTADDLLSALGLDNAARLAWLKSTVTSRNAVAQEYRARRHDLMQALCDSKQISEPVANVLARRRATVATLVDSLGTMAASRTLTRPLAGLFESYMHMHCNRILSDQTSERRVLGLLLRTREAISYHPAPAR